LEDTVEIAVLRHQLAVLRRQVAKPQYAPVDRMLLAALAKLLPRERWPVFLVTSSTLLRWHRELVARRWTYSRTGRRRGLDGEVVELVLRLARDNPRWGYLRSVGECRALGARPTGRNILAAFQGLGATYTPAGLRLDRLTTAPRAVLTHLNIDLPWPEQGQG
jgi:hypothetical protein